MAEAGKTVSDGQVLEQHDIQILGALDLDAHGSEDSLVDVVLMANSKSRSSSDTTTMQMCIPSALLLHR